MIIEVWYNSDPMAMLGRELGNTPEVETFCLVWAGDLPITTRGNYLADAEQVWRAFNCVDGYEMPVALGVRSMSVGDVVVLDGTAFRAMGVGFAPTDAWPLADNEPLHEEASTLFDGGPYPACFDYQGVAYRAQGTVSDDDDGELLYVVYQGSNGREFHVYND